MQSLKQIDAALGVDQTKSKEEAQTLAAAEQSTGHWTVGIFAQWFRARVALFALVRLE